MGDTTKLATGFLAATVLILLLAGSTLETGPFSIDEVTYLLAARSLASGSPWAVQNGFEELGSPLLATGWLRLVEGRLVSQYPDLWLWSTAPLYRAFGFSGLFWGNVLAYAACLGLLGWLAWRQFGTLAAPPLAVGIWFGATFSWEYAVAAWPHQAATLAVLAAGALFWRALETAGCSTARLWAAGAGVALGFGCGFRLDVAFAGLALVLVALFRADRRSLDLLGGLVAGSLPGLLLLGFSQSRKFGTWDPFRYAPRGSAELTVLSFLPWLGAVAAALLLWLAVCRLRERARPLRLGWLALLLAAGLGCLLLPSVRSAGARVVDGCFQLLVDLRIRDRSLAERALERGPRGSLVYAGVVKKSLLQSLPFLPIAIAGFLALRRESPRGRNLALVAGSLFGTYVLAYGAFAWHGGMSFNLRYFTPLLPWIALLAAAGLRALAGTSRPLVTWAPAVAAAAIALFAFGLQRGQGGGDLSWQEVAYLDFPLVLAGVLATCLLLARAARSRPRALRWVRAAAGASLAWAGAVAWAVDGRATHRLRKVHAESARAVSGHLPERGLLLSVPTVLFAAAVDRNRVFLANPLDDRLASWPELVEKALSQGVPVFAGMSRPLYEHLKRDPRSTGLEMSILRDGGQVVFVSIRARSS